MNCESVSDENSRNIEETLIPPEKYGNIKQIKTSIINWNTTKYLNY